MATRADRTQYTIFAACGLAALAIALLGWALLDASRTSVGSQKMVQHTEQVLRGIAAMRASVALSESSHRGFRLTGDPQLHSTCEDALEQLRQEWVSLQDEVADNPMQRDRSRRLGRLIEERIQLMIATERVDADRRGMGADPLLAEGMVERATSRIHSTIGELAAEETRLLAVRHDKDAQGQAAMQRLLVFLRDWSSSRSCCRCCGGCSASRADGCVPNVACGRSPRACLARSSCCAERRRA